MGDRKGLWNNIWNKRISKKRKFQNYDSHESNPCRIQTTSRTHYESEEHLRGGAFQKQQPRKSSKDSVNRFEDSKIAKKEQFTETSWDLSLRQSVSQRYRTCVAASHGLSSCVQYLKLKIASSFFPSLHFTLLGVYWKRYVNTTSTTSSKTPTKLLAKLINLRSENFYNFIT